MRTQANPHHWLVDVGTYAGATNLMLPLRPTIQEMKGAWSEIANAAGISERELAARIAAHFRLNPANLDVTEPHAVRLLPEDVARRHGVLPISSTEHTLVVATCDPANSDAEQEIGSLSGRKVIFEVASPGPLLDAIESRYSPDRFVEFVLGELVAQVMSDDGRFVQMVEPQSLTGFDVEASPVVKLTNGILDQAVMSRASDIHIEPDGDDGRIRFRVDGVLQHFMDLPIQALKRVAHRLKMLGGIESGEAGGAERGEFTTTIEARAHQVLIATAPTKDGEKVALRIIDPSSRFSVVGLSMPKPEERMIRGLLKNRDGIIVVAGGSRSGLTRTMYSMLAELATDERNISTLENPIEQEIPRVTQTRYDPSSGTSFATQLQSLLHHDPDVLMEAEIRDAATIAAAVRTATTGRMFVSAIHADSATGVIERLQELGLDRPKIGTFLRGVIAQRLVRRTCPSCARAVESLEALPPKEARLAEAYGVMPNAFAEGCGECRGTGFLGQIAVAEIMTVTPALGQTIAGGASLAEIRREAILGGMRPLRQVALDRVKRGETTLQEVVRVLGSFARPSQPARSTGRALIVDDNEADRRMMNAVLTKMGFPISEAHDGIQALHLLKDLQDISLVLLDLKMPRMDGTEVLRRMRRAVRTAGIPVIVLTASEDPLDEIRLLEAGADDYLRKPIDPARLKARVQAVLRRAGVRGIHA